MKRFLLLIVLLFATVAPLTAAADDVTSSFAIKATGFLLNRATGTFNSSVTLTNNSTSTFFPLWFVVSNLPAGVSLANSNTSAVSNGYQILVPVSNNQLAPGASVSLVVQLRNSSRVSINPTYSVQAQQLLDSNATTTTENGTLTTITDSFVIVSDDGSHIGVKTLTRSAFAADPEAGASSKFQYFSSAGLLWSVTAPSGTAYYIPDPNYANDRILTPSGSRVLLVSAEDGDTSPSINVYESDGTLVYQRQFSDVGQFQRAQLSRNGLFVLLEGGPYQDSKSKIIRVITLSDGTVSDFKFTGTDGEPTISINPAGNFLVVFLTTQVTLP